MRLTMSPQRVGRGKMLQMVNVSFISGHLLPNLGMSTLTQLMLLRTGHEHPPVQLLGSLRLNHNRCMTININRDPRRLPFKVAGPYGLAKARAIVLRMILHRNNFTKRQSTYALIIQSINGSVRMLRVFQRRMSRILAFQYLVHCHPEWTSTTRQYPPLIPFNDAHPHNKTAPTVPY
jgi:hypothetical protein